MRHVFTNAEGIAAGTVWVRSDKGLYGGPVTAIASLSSDGSVVYAGTREDEVYVSSDGGSDWTPLGGASSGHYVAGIELDPRAEGRIVGKAVYGAGFFLSEDGGQTWKNASRGLGSRSMSCLASAADSPDTLFAGTGDAGLFVSRDGGHSWSRTGRRTLGDRIMAVDMTRDGATVYAGTQESGLFVSRDGGGTWDAVLLPFGSQAHGDGDRYRSCGRAASGCHRDGRRNGTLEGRRTDVDNVAQGSAPVRLQCRAIPRVTAKADLLSARSQVRCSSRQTVLTGSLRFNCQKAVTSLRWSARAWACWLQHHMGSSHPVTA